MAAGALDMALEDVIKSKGGGGSAGKRGGKPAQKQGGGNKVKSKTKDTAPPRTKAAAVGKLRLGFTKGLAAALGKAAKAAAASARGTNATSKTETPAKRTPGQTARPVGRPGGLSDKLSMSLDDLAKKDTPKKRTVRAAKAGASKNLKNVRNSRLAAAFGKSMRSKVVRDTKTKRQTAGPRAKAKAKGRAKSNVKMGNFAFRAHAKNRSASDSWSDKRGKGNGKGKSKGKGNDKGKSSKSWSSDWGSRDGGWNKRSSDGERWTNGGKKAGMASADSWGPQKRGGRDGPRNTGSWNRGGADDRNSNGRWSSTPTPSAGAGGRWGHEHDDRDSWSGGNSSREAAVKSWERNWSGDQSSRATSASARKTSVNRGQQGCRIRVTNVPTNLNRRDVKEAFEDIGSVVDCKIERGIAWVTFHNALDAKKATNTFDRGELNGQTIYVTQD